MLREIETALNTRKTWTMAELARTVGVTPEMVRAGIEQLKRMGRLREEDQGTIETCVDGTHLCGGCPFESLCKDPAQRAKVFSKTRS